jgi:hypothetical protein
MPAEFDKLREHLDSGLELDPRHNRIMDNNGGTVGYWEPAKGKVTGLLTIIVYHETDSPEDRLLELGREAVAEQQDELASEGWEIADDGAVVSSHPDWDERFVIFEIVKSVETVKEAADAIALLADHHFEYEV